MNTEENVRITSLDFEEDEKVTSEDFSDEEISSLKIQETNCKTMREKILE